MNLNKLKYESLSFAQTLSEMGQHVKDESSNMLLMQVQRAGDTICALYRNDHRDGEIILKSAEKTINEAVYWIYMLYSAHFISPGAYKKLKISADHLKDIVSKMINGTETE